MNDILPMQLAGWFFNKPFTGVKYHLIALQDIVTSEVTFTQSRGNEKCSSKGFNEVESVRQLINLLNLRLNRGDYGI